VIPLHTYTENISGDLPEEMCNVIDCVNNMLKLLYLVASKTVYILQCVLVLWLRRCVVTRESFPFRKEKKKKVKDRLQF